MDFETYVTQSRRRLLRYAVVLTNDPNLAEDVLHEVLLRAGQSWPDRPDGRAARLCPTDAHP